jgi:Pretoxin HINT domain
MAEVSRLFRQQTSAARGAAWRNLAALFAAAAVALLLALIAPHAAFGAQPARGPMAGDRQASPNAVAERSSPPSVAALAPQGKAHSTRPGPSSSPHFVIAAEGAESGLASAARTCSVNSFTAATLITMADGSKKPIKDVKVGDRVLATDPETGETAARPVTRLIRHGGKHTMVDVGLADGSTISATDHHPFWDATTGEFTYAIDLRPGHQVRQVDSRLLEVAAIRVYDQDLTAYNLTVDGIHTYYAGTTPVLVHNSCGIGPDALSQAGQAADRNGFTRAGRALQKKLGQGKTGYPAPESGSPSAYNPLGQSVLDDLLTSPRTAFRSYVDSAHGPVMEFLLPETSARFGAAGNFMGFL